MRLNKENLADIPSGIYQAVLNEQFHGFTHVRP